MTLRITFCHTISSIWIGKIFDEISYVLNKVISVLKINALSPELQLSLLMKPNFSLLSEENSKKASFEKIWNVKFWKISIKKFQSYAITPEIIFLYTDSNTRSGSVSWKVHLSWATKTYWRWIVLYPVPYLSPNWRTQFNLSYF